MKKLTRRQFLGNAVAAVSVFTIVPRHVVGGPGFTPPSEEITRAIIGVGGMGQGHIGYPGRLLAVCDVNQIHLNEALNAAGEGVKGYTDFREVLARPDIDVIHIATPPHWHAYMSIAAAQAGKDIWCEKPMTRTIGEGCKVVEAVKRYGRMFRVNTWFRFEATFYGSGINPRYMKRLIDSGALGWPLTVHVGPQTGFDWKSYWVGLPHYTPQPIPETLDYDMWLGPAPYKPYHSHRTSMHFRGYWDYDGGGLGDMAQHYLDPVQYFLGKDDESPVFIEADAPQQHDDAVGLWRRVEMTYADGCKIILDANSSAQERIPYVKGPNGSVYRGFEMEPASLKTAFAQQPDPIPQNPDFYEAVRTRNKFPLNEQNAHRSCTLINLAKTSIQLGRPLHYDSNNECFINDPQANLLIHQVARAPWRC